MTLTDRRGASRLRRPRYTGWYRMAAASSDETVGRSGSKTGHWPRWPSSMAAYHRPRNWPPPAALSGCTPIRPRMIGGRIFDDTVLVGFALGRSVYVLAAGELACPGCAAPLRSAAGYVPPRGGPSRCGPRPPSAPTPETRCWAPTRGGTPAGRRRRGDGATPRRARSAVCRVAARLAADLLVHEGCSWQVRFAGADVTSLPGGAILSHCSLRPLRSRRRAVPSQEWPSRTARRPHGCRLDARLTVDNRQSPRVGVACGQTATAGADPIPARAKAMAEETRRHHHDDHYRFPHLRGLPRRRSDPLVGGAGHHRSLPVVAVPHSDLL